MNLPIAVCGIDTGVGKSVVTGLLARHLLDQGSSVITQKLVQTGCVRPEDIFLHRRLMGIGWQPVDEQRLTCPYCFPLAASPHLAAEKAGATAVDPTRLNQAADQLAKQFDQLIIEGAGGLLVPLTRSLLLLDYLQSRNWPLLLVTSPRLGSINHTLLCLEAVKQRQMRLLGLVYNLHGSYPLEIVSDSLSVFRAALAKQGFPEKIVLLPDLKESRAANWDTLLS